MENITFTAKKGETTAFIGSTGSGKSTLINLIPRFYDVTKGRILVNGRDVRDVTQHELRARIGYVPQKGVLFSGTIESNLKYGGDSISDRDMEQAAQIAQATEFIGAKPDGYQSEISQGGGNVSGGQKQRLSIARAIAKHPEIYIFDDSFSALDYKTDVALRKELKEKTAGATVLIVAQRISTILHAEQIIVLDEGNRRRHSRRAAAKLRGIPADRLISAVKGGIGQMSRTPTKRRGPMGGHGGMGMSVEKAKDFKGTMKTLWSYLSNYKFAIILVAVFAIGSTIFSIVGPKILGNATTELFNGLMDKLQGGSGINFGKIGEILLFLIGLYVVSASFSFIQGFIMTNVSQKLTYRLRKNISEKIGRMPMRYFDGQTHGEVLSRITNDIDTLSQSLNQSITQLITSATMLVGILVMMFSINWIMTLVSLLILPISLGIITKIIKNPKAL